MLNKIDFNQKNSIIFIEVLLIYLGFWFLLNSLSTNGIWETVVLNLLFFLILPNFLLKRNFEKEDEGLIQEWLVWLQVGVAVLIFAGLLWFGDLSFLKLNYLARTDWFVGDWWAIIFFDLIFIPIILFSQEFFFRGFLTKEFSVIFSNKASIVIQAVFFVIFEMLFFEVFVWQFVLFNFVLALFLGFLYSQTKSVWYSFATRWLIILLLDGSILYKIQQFKF